MILYWSVGICNLVTSQGIYGHVETCNKDTWSTCHVKYVKYVTYIVIVVRNRTVNIFVRTNLYCCWKDKKPFSTVRVVYFFSLMVFFWWARSPFCLYSPLPPLRGQPSVKLLYIPDGSPSTDWQSTVGLGVCRI
jgi:hypothetical protein